MPAPCVPVRARPLPARAIAALDAGQSVLVAAPTGSGKTVVAEHAVARALAPGAPRPSTRRRSRRCPTRSSPTWPAGTAPTSVGLLTGDNTINGDAPVVVMTTEVLRNMIYAGSPALDGLRLRGARRGPLPAGHLPGPGVGGGHHPPARRGAAGVPVGHGVQRRGAGRLDDDGAGPTTAGHRGAAARSSCATSTWSATAQQRAAAPGADAGRRPAQPRGRAARRRRPAGARGRAGRPRGAAPRPARFFTPRRPEVVELLGPSATCCRRIYFIFSRTGCDDAVAACLDAGLRLTTPDERVRIRAIAEERTAALTDDDLDVLGYDRWAAALEVGHRRPPRRHGAAVQGGGRGLLRRGPGQGRVRHRDAGARHQHAGPVGGDRAADQVHRRAPGRSSRRASTPSSPAGPGGGASTTSATPSCCGRRSCPSTRWPRWRRAAPTPSLRRSGRPTTWPPTWCAGTSPPRPTTCSTCPSPSTRPTGPSCGSRPASSASRSASPRLGREAACERGDVEEYRGLRQAERRGASGARGPTRGAVEFAAVAAHARATSSSSDGARGWPCCRWPTARAARCRCAASTPTATSVTLRRRRLRRAARARRANRAARAVCPQQPGASSTRWPTRCAAPGWHAEAARGRTAPGRRGRRDPERGAAGRPPGRTTAPTATAHLRALGQARAGAARAATTCGARSGRAPSRWPAGSTGCCGCSRPGATSTAGRSPTAASCWPAPTTSATCWWPRPSPAACSTGSTRPSLAGLVVVLHLRAPRARDRRRRRGSRRRRCVAAGGELERLADDLQRRRGGGRPARHPPARPGFVALAHAWAAGEALADVLDDEDLSGGDFVRNVKQLIDLLRQVGDVAPDPATRRAPPARRPRRCTAAWWRSRRRSTRSWTTTSAAAADGPERRDGPQGRGVGRRRRRCPTTAWSCAADAEARPVVEAARGGPATRPAARAWPGGDLCRTLGGRGDEARLARGGGRAGCPVDLGSVLRRRPPALVRGPPGRPPVVVAGAGSWRP